ncbi:HalD/BesD family halogenase [Microbispora sp. CA-102843]|uniref:HalD/BesD family halogenase n=1 Tax=Microbispora sp. CA-102843 TaxID=3239952 RepID=UPI003D8BEA4D
MSTPTDISMADVVDVSAYPLGDHADPRYRAVVKSCQTRLRDYGIVELPGFIANDARNYICAEAERLARFGNHTSGTSSVYSLVSEAGALSDSRFPADHPRNFPCRTAVNAVAYDLIPEDSLLRRLYESDEMAQFIAHAFALPSVHRLTDPLYPLNVVEYGKGDRNDWHFDGGRFAPFTVLLDIRSAESGGDFEYVPNVRSKDDENYDAVSRVLHGDRDLVHGCPRAAGSLLLLVGTRTLHRVTPVGEGRSRLIAVLSYSPHPGMRVSDHFLRARFGRTS